MPQLQPAVLENVELIFRNFTGEARQYNDEGQRNFAIKLDDDTAASMAEDGWAVKWLKPKESDDDEGGELESEQAILPVTVRYDKGRPPRVIMITSRGPTNLGEDGVGMLDWAVIKEVDLIVRPFYWEMKATGKNGIKAYLQSMYVTIEEDPLELKHGELLDALEKEREPEE